MLISKNCQCCGRFYETIPTKHRDWIDCGLLLGVFWECDCGSTLFMPNEDNLDEENLSSAG
jgi:hypothetical protein